MSVIIRLQGLPWTANALDIRRYFQGLTIPEGGVHIVGGESGDAFIAFSTDEDARCAMLMDLGRIKDAKIKLLLSSRTEMQKVIEAARNRNLAMQGLLSTPGTVPTAVLTQPQQPGTVLMAMHPGTTTPTSPTDPMVQYLNRATTVLPQFHPVGTVPTYAPHLLMSASTPLLEAPQPASYEPSKKSGNGSDSNRAERNRSRRSRSPRRRSRDRRNDYSDRNRRRNSSGSPPARLSNRATTVPDNFGLNHSKDVDSRGPQPAPEQPRFRSRWDGNAAEPYRPVPEPIRSRCLIMRGVPYDTEPRSIREFFAGLSVPVEDGVRLLIDERNHRPNLAFVRFLNEPDRELVLKERSQRYRDVIVDVVPCTDEDFANAPIWNDAKPWSHNDPNRTVPAGNETCVAMRGLGFKCFKDDVVKFFDGFRVVDVVVLPTRPAKMAYVEFGSPMEACRAVTVLNGKKMEFRTVELSLCSKDEMNGARQQHGMEPYQQQQPNRAAGPVHFENQVFDCCLIMGLPLNATDRDILDFLSPVEVVPVAIHIMLDTSGRPVGDAFCEFANPHDCFRAVKRDGFPLRPDTRLYLNIRPVTRHDLQDALGVPGGGSRNGSGPQFGNERRTDDWAFTEPNSPIRDGGGGDDGGSKSSEPGSVMEVQNLPYRATYDDILRFFKGYGLTRDRISRRFNENGLPTGEARLFFPSTKDAQAALRQLNFQMLLGRCVNLRIRGDLS